MPLLSAFETALHSAVDSPGPPRLMLITFAPCVTAQLMPAVIAEVRQLPSASQTLTGRSFDANATAATPRLVFVEAGAIPETRAPCPLSSVQGPVHVLHVPVTQLAPLEETTFAVPRSSCA